MNREIILPPEICKMVAQKYKINLKNIGGLKWWCIGMNVELEHGSKWGPITNLTHDDLDMTARIVIAHLLENPFYYKALKQMEREGDRYWSTRVKPPIFHL